MATSSLFSSCDMLYAEVYKGQNSCPSYSWSAPRPSFCLIFSGLNLLKTAIFKPWIKHESKQITLWLWQNQQMYRTHVIDFDQSRAGTEGCIRTISLGFEKAMHSSSYAIHLYDKKACAIDKINY